MPAAAANFPVVITAVDKTKEAMERVEKRFEHLTKPLDKVASATKSVVGENGVSRAIEGLLKVGKSGAVAQAGLFGAAGELETVADVAGFAGVAVTGFAGAAAIATGAAMEFGTKTAESVAHQQRLADAIGVSVNDLNVMTNAFAANGVERSAAQSDFKALADTIYSAKWSGNNQLLAAMGALGVKARFLRDGNLDVKASLIDLAGVFEGKSAGFQQKYAAMFGVTDLLPLLRQGSAATAAALDDADRRTAKLTNDQIKASKEVEDANARMKQSWDKLKMDLAQRFVIPWVQPLIDGVDKLAEGTAHLQVDSHGNLNYVDDAKPANAVSTAAPGAPTLKGNESKAAQAMRFFRDKGWTPAQAAGIVANLLGESGLKSNALGDHGTAYGIGQWHADRQANFEKLFGHSIRRSTLAEQLAFTQWELTHTEKLAGRRIGQASTTREAAAAGVRYYERSANMDRDTAIRTALADQVVKVEVDFTNAPRGTVAQTSGSKNVQASTRIAHAMPDAA